MALLARIILPLSWDDDHYQLTLKSLHTYLAEDSEHHLDETKTLYIHLISEFGLNGHTIDTIQQILINTYFVFMDKCFHIDVIIIPPVAGYEPLLVLPGIQYVLKAESGDSVLSQLAYINKQRKSAGLSTITTIEYKEIQSETTHPVGVKQDSTHKQLIPVFEGAVLGGTYDRLHAGHKLMLTLAVISCTKYMEIGVTDESMLTKKKFKELIQPFEYRTQKVLSFLKALNPNIDYVMLRLLEPYANTKTSTKLHVIVVSPETLATAEEINKVRVSSSLHPLHVVVVKYVEPPPLLEGKDTKLSSTTLRELDAVKLQNQ